MELSTIGTKPIVAVKRVPRQRSVKIVMRLRHANRHVLFHRCLAADSAPPTAHRRCREQSGFVPGIQSANEFVTRCDANWMQSGFVPGKVRTRDEKRERATNARRTAPRPNFWRGRLPTARDVAVVPDDGRYQKGANMRHRSQNG